LVYVHRKGNQNYLSFCFPMLIYDSTVGTLERYF